MKLRVALCSKEIVETAWATIFPKALGTDLETRVALVVYVRNANHPSGWRGVYLLVVNKNMHQQIFQRERILRAVLHFACWGLAKS
jgi:hypothetical protein